MRPIIGITMGDPAGNGAELSIQALSHKNVYENCKPIIIGDANCMQCALELLGKQNDNVFLTIPIFLALFFLLHSEVKHTFVFHSISCLFLLIFL